MLYLSPSIKKVLKKIGDNEISKSLLSLEGKENDFTFIDCDGTDSAFITFVRVKDALKIFDNNRYSKHILQKSDISNFYSHYNAYRSITEKSRNSIKVGKFAKTIGDFTNPQIEEFVNLFKSAKSTIDGLKFEIVKGDQIAEWYSSKKYYGHRWSQLHGSCMASSPKDTFDIYTKNPDVCSMLILKKDNKLAARAIVWKLDKPVNGCEFYMDRIYTVEDHQQIILRDYAIKNGWCYRGRDNWDYGVFVGYMDLKKVDLKVTVKKAKYKAYPFMDTFKSLDKGILTNKYNELGFGLLLNRTDGSSKKCHPSFKNRVLRFLHIK